MTVHDFGFALTLALLLLAPELLVGELGSASLGAIGFVVWLILSWRLPLLRFLRMNSLLALLGFVTYALLVSFLSARPSSIAFALQLAGYAFAAGMLLPAYLADADRRARGLRILAWIGAIYCAGLVVSLWTGPFYDVTGSHAKHYEGETMLRGVGFSSSVNLAGGVAAIITLFALFFYRPRGKLPIGVTTLAIAGLVATMSRGAMAGFVAGLTAIAMTAGLRFLLGGGISVQARGVALLALVGTAVVLLPATLAGIDTAAQRMVLDPAARAQDIEARAGSWAVGVQAWWSSDSIVEQVIGAGMKSAGRSKSGVYVLSHSTYVTILRDFGVVGLLMFVAVMLTAITRCAGTLLGGPNPAAAFALAGLVLISVENAVHIFNYAPAVVVLLVLLLTCGEMGRHELGLHGTVSKANVVLRYHV